MVLLSNNTEGLGRERSKVLFYKEVSIQKS